MATESFWYIFIGVFSSWKEQCCLQGWGKQVHLHCCAFRLLCPVRWEEVEVAGGTGVSGALCCCMGRHRLPWELVSLGHHTRGSLLTASVSFSNQRAAGAKACWGVNQSLLCTCCTSGVYFKQLSGSSLCLASGIPHCPAAAQRVSVLELVCHQPHGKCSRQFKTWLAAHLRMLKGWVEGGPSQRVVLLGRQSE